MLTVGLTGGIGSGKSTVAAELARLGARVVDADLVAREVVEPGTPTLAAVAERFGAYLVRDDGTLDRAALAALVFPDPQALADLDAITGPAIAARVAELRDVATEGVSVFDMPLLVERRLWPKEHLTVVVGADVEARVRRLVEQRGLDEADARHRIDRQATDAERRAAADVWVDNDGPVAETLEQAGRLWTERLVPYDDNLRAGRPAERDPRAVVVAADPTWSAQADRVLARLEVVLGDRALSLDHIGSTSVPGLAARDVLDVQVGVRELADADDLEFAEALRRRGFVAVGGMAEDRPKDGDGTWPKRFFANADPGRAVNLHVREHGSAAWTFARQLRDWLRANPTEQDAYAALKRGLAASTRTARDYAEAKEPWFDTAHEKVWAWSRSLGSG